MRPKVMPANPMVAGGQHDALSMSSAALVRTYHLHGTRLPTVVSGGLNFHGVTIRARVGPAGRSSQASRLCMGLVGLLIRMSSW